ncbi:MAG: class I adenylate-forming enzyme family protein [Acidimicrobiales bacterium]|jgi:long-chain acyl-CoA synthetase
MTTIGQEIEQQLTGPGGMFEVVREDVGGVEMRVYRNRLGSLREIAVGAGGRSADNTFLVYGERRISYPEFVALARAGSTELAAGPGAIGPKDRVAVLAANCPEWCLSFWSAVSMGAVLVGLNGWWKADEILYGLEDSGAKALVADKGRYERIAGQLGGLGDLRVVYLIGAEPSEVAAPGGDVVLRPASDLFPEDAGAGSNGSSGAADPWTSPITEDDPAVIFYTSGTTGRSKGAVSTHRSMVANLQNTFFIGAKGAMVAMAGGEGGSVLGASSDGQTVGMLTSPLFHVSGCHSNLVVSFAAGMRLVIPPGRFDPANIMATIEREHVSIWSAVPTMIWRVADDPRRHDYDLSSVTSIAYGGSPSAGELQRMVRETFPNVNSIGNAYGLTETSSVATVNSGQDARDRPDSVGRPMPVVELKIVDPLTPTAGIEAAESYAAGVAGEICVRGPILMAEYWNKPIETQAVLQHGWLRTGDLGNLDEDGFLYVTDRAKDMIIRGGENVYCIEIENRLVEHPAVAEAAVVGVPHPSLGEEVKAIVRFEEGQSATAEELRAFVAETLADFKVPTYVTFADEPLPRNASGKLLKTVLRGSAEAVMSEPA